eukprot:GHVP01066666.1.p1 GENE.GHVP01066666.1~~GHVP01066666.1.p1  ORF type:complete len:359 (+),score=62.56 GHVP01066666.1:148-1224(+)
MRNKETLRKELSDEVRDAKSPGLHRSFKLPSSLGNSIEIFEGRFYWALVKRPRNLKLQNIHFFSTDDEFVYENFCADFGPHHLGNIYNYTKLLIDKFQDPRYQNMAIVHYCDATSYAEVANSAFLIGAFLVSVLKVPAKDAFALFARKRFRAYRDATYGACEYELTILDCLEALEVSRSLGWWDYTTFNEPSYRHFSETSNGDLNWIIPHKFVAFSGPIETKQQELGYPSLTAEEIVPILKQLEIEKVVRLNQKQYNAEIFTANGFEHFDLFFPDGSCLFFRFPARLWIAWNRICRPGSILGPQQKFLLALESELVIPQKNFFRLLENLSPKEQTVAEKGEKGQGERLVEARRTTVFC